MQKTTDEKNRRKELLEGYQCICLLIEYKSRDLERWMNDATRMANLFKKMPGSENNKILTLYLEICDGLNNNIKELVKDKCIVNYVIENINDCDVEYVMKLKYIDALSWTEISNKTKKPTEHYQELHKIWLRILGYS
ncbi:hypothetical protein [Acetobacterium bakii]|uniref:Uncharacterized protein n=1 Tax=Acetobacterium bakii TaxID=52689 RepID=A0A0L6TYY3_9FIRM|nr:hypothetical protein [Acetobacterium bakii]KNZ41453.1 hypothetical protein AKG39_11835 [Acetobacterium bakii]